MVNLTVNAAEIASHLLQDLGPDQARCEAMRRIVRLEEELQTDGIRELIAFWTNVRCVIEDQTRH